MFGLVSSIWSEALQFGIKFFPLVLKPDRNTTVCMPAIEIVVRLNVLFAAKYPTVEDMFAVAGKIKLYLGRSGKFVNLNVFYND